MVGADVTPLMFYKKTIGLLPTPNPSFQLFATNFTEPHSHLNVHVVHLLSVRPGMIHKDLL